MSKSKMDYSVVEECVHRMLSEGLGLDLSDPNLRDTPKRIARMYTQEFLAGHINDSPTITVFPNDEGYDQIIMLDNIPFISLCSHHFLPFEGLAWFLYIPDKWLIGASKPNRIINFFGSTPQLQERMGQQIMDNFVAYVQPKGALLVMRALHGCMSCRGVKQGREGGMTTSVSYGAFRDNLSTRQEGLDLILLSRSF